MPDTAPTLIGAAETCQRIGIDRSTLTRWVQLGKIAPAMQLPGTRGAYLFRPEDVQRRRLAYVAERAERTEATA